jgi:hypothetical protein
MASRWAARFAVVTAIMIVGMAMAGEASAGERGVAELAIAGEVLAVQVDGGAACTDWATGPNADQDLWRFQVEDGAFLSVELTFRGDEGLSIRKADGIDGGAAWVATKAGSALSGGRAETTTATSFRLVQACPATRRRAVGGLAPINQPINQPVDEPIKPGSAGEAAANAAAQSTPKKLASGIDVAATVTLGASLVLAGAMLLIVRRRPRGRHRMHSTF